MGTEQDETPARAAGIFVGPLRGGKSNASKTAKHLFQMLLALGVRSMDIGKVIVDPEEGFALAQLHSREAEDFIVNACKDVVEVLNVFDLRLLTSDLKHFRVVRKNSPRLFQSLDTSTLKLRREKLGHRAGCSSQHFSDDECSVNASPVKIKSPKKTFSVPATLEHNNEKQSPTLNLRRALSSSKSFTESSSSTSEVGFEHLVEEMPHPVLVNASTSMSASNDVDMSSTAAGPVVKVDVKTSTPHVTPCFCPETVFYHKKQHVGTEDRHVEFKRGGNLSDMRTFRGVLGKYLCAFLNTEGGTIFFGVTDDGKVLGVEACAKTEDHIRLTIDNTVASIKPTVSPSEYNVNFAKIMNDEGAIIENLKVLEVCVKPREPPRQRFTFNDVTYVRRDGSLRTV